MSTAPIPIRRHSDSSNHRHRLTPRQKVETLSYVDLGPNNGGFAINVSEGGMTFQGIRPLQKDDLIHVRFKLLGNNAVETMGQVIWLNDLGKGGGLQFIDLPEDSRRLINQWLSVPAQPGILKETIAARSPQADPKQFPSGPAVRLTAHSDNPTASAGPDAIDVAPDPPPCSLASAQVTTADQSVPPLNRMALSAKAPEMPVHGREKKSKRTWIMISAVGLATCLMIAFAIMINLDVTSVQFRWPFETTTGNTARLAGGSEVDTRQISSGTEAIDKVPSGTTASGSAALVAPSASSIGNSPAEPAAPKRADTGQPPAKTPSPLKTDSSGISLRQITKPVKAMAPNTIVPSRTTELAPPQLATDLEPALQLPVVVSEASPPPAPVVNPPQRPAQQNSKFDAAQLITQKAPVYPAAAKAAGFSGSVELHFTIGADGNVRDVHVAKGNNLLGRAAAEALQTWHYRPARRDGIPVETDGSTVFVFSPN